MVEEVLGKGASSVVRLGVKKKTGEKAAIKAYYLQPNQTLEEVVLYIHELSSIYRILCGSFFVSDAGSSHKPRKKPKGVEFKVNDFFIKIFDFSDVTAAQNKLMSFNPRRIREDTELGLYCVMELAQYSLADYISDRRKAGRMVPLPEYRDLTLQLLLAGTALQEVGLIHLDIKPENIMLTFDGRWVVSDMDGCVKSHKKIDKYCNSSAYTCLYVSPELGDILLDSNDYFQASFSMDVWALGLTISDLALTDHLLGSKYDSILLENEGDKAAFLEWITSRKFQVPDFSHVSADYSGDLVNLVSSMLNVDYRRRPLCRDLLHHPFVLSALKKRMGSSDKLGDSRRPLPEENPALPLIMSFEKGEMGESSSGQRKGAKIMCAPPKDTYMNNQLPPSDSDSRGIMKDTNQTFEEVPEPTLSFHGSAPQLRRLQRDLSRSHVSAASGSAVGTLIPLSEDTYGWVSALERRQNAIVDILDSQSHVSADAQADIPKKVYNLSSMNMEFLWGGEVSKDMEALDGSSPVKLKRGHTDGYLGDQENSKTGMQRHHSLGGANTLKRVKTTLGIGGKSLEKSVSRKGQHTISPAKQIHEDDGSSGTPLSPSWQGAVPGEQEIRSLPKQRKCCSLM